jgi:hypothetical protein
MTIEETDVKLIIKIILWIIIIVGSMCFRLYKQHQARMLLHPNITNEITSQTRPLIIYHVPIHSIQES